MADNASNAEVRIVDQLGGEGFVFAKIGANESCQIIELAAHFPTFDDLLDPGQAPLEATAMRLLFQNNLGENGQWAGQELQGHDRLIAGDDPCVLESAHPLQAWPG